MKYVYTILAMLALCLNCHNRPGDPIPTVQANALTWRELREARIEADSVLNNTLARCLSLEQEPRREPKKNTMLEIVSPGIDSSIFIIQDKKNE